MQIKQVYSTIESLLNELQKNVEDYWKHENNNKSIWTKRFENEGDTTDFIFASRIQFIKLLCCLPYPEDSRQKFLESLKDYYADKITELKILDEFEHDYQSDAAIRWYTRPTFLCHLINKALRHSNIEAIFIFGFFIQDIYRELKKKHEKFKIVRAENPIMKVYRGQMMHKNEMNKLKHDLNPILNNSFLSTTFDRSLALLFLNPLTPSDEEFQCVLFEIEIDIRKKTLPYADISDISHIRDEEECLFLPGITFTKIRSNSYNGDYENENILIIKLKLDDNNSCDEKDLNNPEKNERIFLKNNISVFAKSTYTPMPKEFDKFFDGLMNLYPSEKEWILAIKYHSYAPRSGLDSKIVLSYYEKALNIWQEYVGNDELNCDLDLGHLYKDMGRYYQYQIKDLMAANKQYDLAVSHYNVAIDKLSTDNDQMSIFSNLSSIYEEKMKIENNENQRKNCLRTIKYREYQIGKLLTKNEKKAGFLLQEVGRLYQTIDDYDNALNNYAKAINIFDGVVDEFVLEIYEQCVHIYMRHKQNYQEALQYQRKYHQIALVLHAGDDWDKAKIPESHLCLAKICLALNQDDLANQNFKSAMQLYEKEKKMLECNMDHLSGSFAEEIKNKIYSYLEKINYIQPLLRD